MKVVKKALSLVICTSMMLGVITPTFAVAEPIPKKARSQLGYEQLREGLYETMNGLDFTTLKNEETAVKFNVSEGGEYVLTYHVERGTKTEQINVSLNVGKKYDDAGRLVSDPNQIALEVSLKNTIVDFQEHLFPYQGSWEKQSGSLKKNLAKDSSLVAAKESDKQASILIGDFANLRIKLKKDDVYIWANKIKKGNITEFTLSHNGEVETINVLNGLKNFEILPVHLYEDAGILSSKKIIDYPTEIPGSKPGVAVNIDKPKKIGQNGSFEYLTDAELSKINAALILWIESEESTENKQIRLDFDLGSSSLITGDIINEDKFITDSGNVLSIFLAKDSKYLTNNKDKVIEWDSLEKNLLIGATIELSGEPIEGVSNSLYEPENKGYTYMQFSARRAGISEAYLSIVPYKINANAKYVIYQKYLAGSSNWNKVIEYSYDKKDSVEEIVIPINSTVEQYYKVEVIVEGQNKPLISQEMRYNPKNEIAPPEFPRIKDVVNVYAVSDESDQVIGLDLIWDVPQKDDLLKYLEKGDMYYELFLHSPDGKTKTLSKVFKVSLNAQKNIEVTVYAGTAGDGVQPELRYNPQKNTITMENVLLRDVDSKGWERIQMPDNYLEGTEYPSEGPGDKDLQVLQDINYKIPNTIYISMRAVYSVKGEKNVFSLESNKKSIALSQTEEILPTPNEIESTPNKTVVDENNNSVVSETITFNNVDISRYVKYQLNPLRWYLSKAVESQYKGVYEILLYTTDEAPAFEGDLIEIDVVENGEVVLVESQKEALRKGQPLKISMPVQSMNGQGKISITITNLDKNQVYYIKVREKLEAKKETPAQEILDKIIVSGETKEFSFTTETDIAPPTAEELTPPAPGKIFVVGENSNTMCVLEWEEAVFTKPNADSKIYYELVRSSDTQLSSEQLKGSVESVITLNKGVKGFSSKNENLQYYDKEKAEWVDLSPIQSSNKLQLKDDTLRPNSIYYYYVRTVHETNGQKVVSEWVSTSVTTAPIDKPLNLKIEDATKYPYDETKEVVFSFLAPIPSGAQIPTEYDFDIAVLGGSDEEYSLEYPKEKIDVVSTGELEGYTRFVYKISNLKYGERYNIKVRVVDKTIASENEEYVKSLYSEEISYRTEFNEEEYDKDNAYDSWLEKYEQEVNKLKTRDYWVVSTDEKVNSRKYRRGYFPSNTLTTDVVKIELEEGQRVAEVYLPLDIVEKLNKKNEFIVIEKNGVSLEIRPNTVTKINESVQQAIKMVGNGRIKDFYIKFRFEVVNSNGLIKGETPISPMLSVNVSSQMINRLDADLDKEILETFDSIVIKEKEILKEDLRAAIDKYGPKSEKLNELVSEAINSVTQILDKTSSRIISKEFNKTLEITDLERPFLIASNLNASIVKALYLSSQGWISTKSYTIGQVGYIEASSVGDYVFVGVANGNNLIPDIPQEILDLVNKYSLSDILKLDKSGLNQSLTKEQVYNTVARIMGAPLGTNSYQFLKSRGFNGLSLNQSKIDTQADVIYLVMQLYEKIYYKPISSTVIKDRSKVSNIGSFQENQKQYILAAVELKIVTPVNNKVEPKISVTTNQLLGMLSKVVPK